MRCLKVIAHRGPDTRRPSAFVTHLLIAAGHAVHICRRAAQVREITFKALHPADALHLFQHGGFGSAADKLALVGGYGAEAASPEASPVNINREFYHLPCRYGPFLFITRMGCVVKGQVIDSICLSLRSYRHWRIDHHHPVAAWFNQPHRLLAVARLLKQNKILSISFS